MAITINNTDTVTASTNRNIFVIQDTILPNCNFNKSQKSIELSSCSVNVIVSPAPQPNASPLEITILASQSIQKCQPIFISDIGYAVLASQTGYKADGIAINDALLGSNVTYVSEGHISKQDWFTITGEEFLRPGIKYYLAINGMLTIIPPVSGIAQQIAVAVSTTMLDIQIGDPVYLA